MRWLAQLGGFLARTRAGDPGVTVPGNGLHHLAALATMERILRPPPPQHVGKG